MNSVRYVVVKVNIRHDDKVDPTKLLARAELSADEEGGHIESSEIVDVLTEAEANS